MPARRLLIVSLSAVAAILAAWAVQAAATPAQVEYATVEIIAFTRGERGYQAAGWGSGALVDASGLIATAFQVVGDPQSRTLLNPEGLVGVSLVEQAGAAPLPAYLGRVVTYSVALDLALIEITELIDGRPLPEGSFFPVQSLAGLRDRAPQPGAILTAYGFGAGIDRPATVVTGTLARRGALSGYGGAPVTLSMTHATLAAGLIGGPVVDASGTLAGLALGTARSGGLGVVRPWEEIRNWALGQLPISQTAPPAVVTGQVVDHATGRGIRGGLFIVLKPNVEPSDFLAEPDEADVAAWGESDRDGEFVSDPPVATGVGYHMIVYAQGYRTAFSADPVRLDEQTCPGAPRCDFGRIELASTRR